MNILFTVCGRAGSKGVMNKNLKDFMEIPLVYYTLAAIKLYKEHYAGNDMVCVVLNTDSKDLIDIVKAQDKLDINVIRRDESLGGDAVPKVSVIKDCMYKCEVKIGVDFDVIVDLDITSPIRAVCDIKKTIDKKLARKDTDVVYSVTSSRRNPYFNMVREKDGYFMTAISSTFTSRQQAPVLYDMNASIYAYSPRALKEKDDEAFFNDKADAIFMKDTAVLDIDSEEDFELMEVLAGYFYGKYPEYGEIRDEARLMQGRGILK